MNKKLPKRYVRSPRPAGGKYVVEIVEGFGPLAPVIESHESASMETAFQIFRQIMKDMGRGF